jgi:hypothetical protein
LLSLSTTFFLFLQTRDLSMQLSNERMKHTAEGEAFLETEIYLREEEKDRNIEGDVNIDNELEYYGKVRMKTKITRATYKYAYTLSLTPLS